MSIFKSTWEHIKQGEHYLENVAKKTGTKLHDFYVEAKPKVEAFVKKEEEALKQGAHKVKELYQKEAPVVRRFLQEEAELIQNKIDHKLDERHQEYLHRRNRAHKSNVDTRVQYHLAQPASRPVPRARPLPKEVSVRAHERSVSSGVTNVRQHTRCINYKNKIYCLNDELTEAKKTISGAEQVTKKRRAKKSSSSGIPNILRG